VTVLVVDDSPAFRLAARAVLARAPGFDAVGEAAGGVDGVAQALALRPDLVLMDVRMPDLDGVAATAQVLQALPRARVVLCSTAEPPAGADASGACAFLAKESLSPAVLQALWSRVSPRPAPAPG
jgi:DNA-binding NarL/FixJ family response regulator